MEGKKPRPAAHAGCSCCVFVLDSAPLPAPQPSLSIVQQVMGVGPPEVASLHPHVQREFNRCVCRCACVCVCECMSEVCVKMFLIQILCIQLGEQGRPAGSGVCRLKLFTPVTNSSHRTNSRCIRTTSAASNTSWIQGGSRLKRQLQPRWHCYCRRLAGLLTS